jgi:multiple sugar transport system permease protein
LATVSSVHRSRAVHIGHLKGSGVGHLADWWFQFLWNDLMGPLIYIIDIEKYTISVGLMFLRSSIAGAVSRRGKPMEHLLMAGSVIAMLPSIVIFFTLQRYFIKGVIMTGIKG